MEPRYFFHIWSRPEYFFLPKPGPEYFFQKKPRPPPWESNGRSLTEVPAEEIPVHIRDEIHGNCREVSLSLSKRLQAVRGVRTKQADFLKSLQIRGDDGNGNNRYAYAISSIRATLHEIDESVEETITTLDKLCCSVSTLSGSLNVALTDVDHSSQNNWIGLKPPEMLSPEHQIPRYTQQRTDQWKERRSVFRVTGSTLHSALGLRKLKQQKLHYDKVIYGKEEIFDANVLEKLQHGVQNEVNAVATLTGIILPFLFPKESIGYVEEGWCELDGSERPLMLVSPDGSIRDLPLEDDVQPRFAVEIKCPFPKPDKIPVCYEVPQYYVCQLLAEMAALEVRQLLFVCYSGRSSTVFLVNFDDDLWEKIFQEADKLYGIANPKRPSTTSKFSDNTKERLKIFCSG